MQTAEQHRIDSAFSVLLIGLRAFVLRDSDLDQLCRRMRVMGVRYEVRLHVYVLVLPVAVVQ